LLKVVPEGISNFKININLIHLTQRGNIFNQITKKKLNSNILLNLNNSVFYLIKVVVKEQLIMKKISI